jgi:hypothetical protein
MRSASDGNANAMAPKAAGFRLRLLCTGLGNACLWLLETYAAYSLKAAIIFNLVSNVFPIVF